jgi:hypothetical protein
MCNQTNSFNFPEKRKGIDITTYTYNSNDWRKANSIGFGGNGTPKVTVQGQHHNDFLYMHFLMDDEDLRPDDDSITICIDSLKESVPNPDNILLKCILKYNNNGGQLTYKKCNKSESKWEPHLPTPGYLLYKIDRDEHNSCWSSIIQINFGELRNYGINSNAFGLYIKVLDYYNEDDLFLYYWPETADKGNSTYFIPHHEQWAVGHFKQLFRKPKIRRHLPLTLSKFIKSRLTFWERFNKLTYLKPSRKLGIR